MYDYNTPEIRCQHQAKLTKYAQRKRTAMAVGALYWNTSLDNIGDQIFHCGDRMIIRKYETGEIDTAYSMFCGARLCPVCAHRRSLKQYAMLSQIMNYCDEQRTKKTGKGYAYIMMTLTVKNCEDLSSALDDMQIAFTRLKRSTMWQESIKGAYRTTEITINPETLQYHPHFHVLCAVNPSYFKSKTYISTDKLIQAWKNCMRLDYDPVCHIENCYSKDGSDAKLEASKYILKSLEPLKDIPIDVASAMLVALHNALQHRKMRISYGVIRKAQHELGLSDADSDLLVDDDSDDALLKSLRPEVDYIYQLMEYSASQHAYMALPHLKWTDAQDMQMVYYISKLDSLISDQKILTGDDDDPLHVIQFLEQMHKKRRE